MKAAPADQLRLLDLAGLDSEIVQLRHRRANLPELAALRSLGQQRNVLTERLIEYQTKVSDAEQAQQRLESDLEPARARLVRNQQRVDAGEVPDAKALQGLVDEIKHLLGRISHLEDDELDAMQLVEDAAAERDAVAAERAIVDEQARGVIKQRDAALAEIDQALATAQADRDVNAKALPADLLALYTKISARHGVGASHLERGRCSGCQIEANAADLRRYADAATDDVVRCEECDRILVRTETSGI